MVGFPTQKFPPPALTDCRCTALVEWVAMMAKLLTVTAWQGTSAGAALMRPVRAAVVRRVESIVAILVCLFLRSERRS